MLGPVGVLRCRGPVPEVVGFYWRSDGLALALVGLGSEHESVDELTQTLISIFFVQTITSAAVGP